MVLWLAISVLLIYPLLLFWQCTTWLQLTCISHPQWGNRWEPFSCMLLQRNKARPNPHFLSLSEPSLIWENRDDSTDREIAGNLCVCVLLCTSVSLKSNHLQSQCRAAVWMPHEPQCWVLLAKSISKYPGVNLYLLAMDMSLRILDSD